MLHVALVLAGRPTVEVLAESKQAASEGGIDYVPSYCGFMFGYNTCDEMARIRWPRRVELIVRETRGKIP
jgi:hypothetical protein